MTLNSMDKRSGNLLTEAMGYMMVDTRHEMVTAMVHARYQLDTGLNVHLALI